MSKVNVGVLGSGDVGKSFARAFAALGNEVMIGSRSPEKLADFVASAGANVRSKGPLGKLYPFPCCIHEGDTPSFLGLIDNGLASAMSPAYGGWGGRYVWRRPAGEPRPFWTQGGDSYPGRDSSRDTVVGADGKTYTSDQATIWRWRTALQHDFAARMDWTIKDVRVTPSAPIVPPSPATV